MAKELYLYSPIYSFTAEDIIRQMEENSKEDITLRMMSPGGGVFAGWGIASKMKEKKIGKIVAKVDGAVASFASILLFYADEVKALSISNIMIHRASGPTTTPEDKELLDKVNRDLKMVMEKRIDSAKLKELKGHTIADIFESEPRIDINLTAEEARQIGLVNEIFDMTPSEVEAMGEYGKFFGIAANSTSNSSNQNNNMDLSEIKAKYPSVYEQIVQVGVKQERNRILPWNHFITVDPEAVKKGIESGEEISQLQIIEFTEKKQSVEALKKLGKETNGNVTSAAKAAGSEEELDETAKKAKAEKEKIEAEKKDFFKNVNSLTGVKIYE